jgi:hypothetical protein
MDEINEQRASEIEDCSEWNYGKELRRYFYTVVYLFFLLPPYSFLSV